MSACQGCGVDSPTWILTGTGDDVACDRCGWLYKWNSRPAPRRTPSTEATTSFRREVGAGRKPLAPALPALLCDRGCGRGVKGGGTTCGRCLEETP